MIWKLKKLKLEKKLEKILEKILEKNNNKKIKLCLICSIISRNMMFLKNKYSCICQEYINMLLIQKDEYLLILFNFIKKIIQNALKLLEKYNILIK